MRIGNTGKLKSSDFYIIALVLFCIWKLVFSGISWREGVFLQLYIYINYLCNILVLILLMIRFITNFVHKNTNYFFLILILLIFTYYSSKITNNDTLVYTLAFIILGYDISFQRIINVYYKTLLVCLIAILLFYSIGVTQDVIIDFGYAIGHSLGTYHPNNFASIATTFILIWGYLNYSKKTIFLGSILGAIIIYLITASRTSVIIVFLFSIFILIFRLMQKVKAVRLLNLLKFSIVVLFGGSIYLMLFYGQVEYGIFSDANFLVRFSSGFYIYQRYGIDFFGNEINLLSIEEAIRTGRPPLVLDSGYMSLLLNHGLFLTILFLIGLIIFYNKAIKQQQYILMVIGTLFMITGLTEQNMFMIQYNFTLLAIFSTLEANCKQKEMINLLYEK